MELDLFDDVVPNSSDLVQSKPVLDPKDFYYYKVESGYTILTILEGFKNALDNKLSYCGWEYGAPLPDFSTTFTCVNSLHFTFKSCKCGKLDLSNWDVSKIISLKGTFSECVELEELIIDNWDVSKVRNMGLTFNECVKLKSLDLACWDTSSVLDLPYIFCACNSLVSLDLNGWDVSKVETLRCVFTYCTELVSLNIRSWDVSNVSAFRHVFTECTSLTDLDVSAWKVSSAKEFAGVFEGCKSLRSIDLSGWDISEFTSVVGLCSECTQLQYLNISNWKFENIYTSDISSLSLLDCVNLTEVNLDNANIPVHFLKELPSCAIVTGNPIPILGDPPLEEFIEFTQLLSQHT